MTDASESRSAAQPQPVPDGAHFAAFAAKVASAFACASEGGASTESPFLNCSIAASFSSASCCTYTGSREFVSAAARSAAFAS